MEDRFSAIRAAIGTAQPSDTVVLLGQVGAGAIGGFGVSRGGEVPLAAGGWQACAGPRGCAH